MRILENKKIDVENHKRATFIRVEPVDLKNTLKEIITSLTSLSWISDFDEEYIRDSFIAKAMPTINEIHGKLMHSITIDKITSDAGEYVVSELSRSVIVKELNYLDIPLSELYNKKVSGNPGFDFHSQNDCEILIFGEAKYLGKQNAYRSGLKQVTEFIDDKKDIKDISDLRDFCSKQSLANAAKGLKGFAIGFSAKGTSSDLMIRNIIKNKHYKSLLSYEEIILVAVNI